MQQRIIKFRAWDVKRHTWYPTPEWSKCEANGSSGLDGTIQLVSDEFFSWEQFTGLLDKNGREIYEGDVLAWKSEHTDNVDVAIVFWDRATARFDWKMPGLNFNEGGIRHFEVTGNIHENPELLK